MLIFIDHRNLEICTFQHRLNVAAIMISFDSFYNYISNTTDHLTILRAGRICTRYLLFIAVYRLLVNDLLRQ